MRTWGRGLGCVHGVDGGAGLREEEEDRWRDGRGGDGCGFGVSEDCGEECGGREVKIGKSCGLVFVVLVAFR